MKLQIPFYKQTTNMNCGPVALMMVLHYFNKKLNLKDIEDSMDIKEGKGVSTIKIAVTAAKLGFKTEFFSRSILFDDKNLELDFYKKYGDVNLEKSKNLVSEAEENKVRVHEKTIPLSKLLSYVTDKSVPILLLDWNVIISNEKSGYQGHFVPLTGYDDNHVYVHNHGFNNPRPFFEINKKIFDKARKSRGTDEDIVIIYNEKLS